MARWRQPGGNSLETRGVKWKPADPLPGRAAPGGIVQARLRPRGGSIPSHCPACFSSEESFAVFVLRMGKSFSRCVFVIARSGSDEAIQSDLSAWIASLTLAMTRRSRDAFFSTRAMAFRMDCLASAPSLADETVE